jgi:hypothetical protein
MEDIREDFTRVTSVLEAYTDFSSIPEEVLDKACKRGTEAHAAIETFLKYGYESNNIFLESYMKWHNIMKPSNCIPERRIYNEEYKLTGAVDMICKLDGQWCLVDFKTPVSKSKTWLPQVAAYKWLCDMEGETPISRILVLQIDRKGKMPKVTEYTDEYEKGIRLYQSALELHRYFNKG